jgi:hypothetical protein
MLGRLAQASALNEWTDEGMNFPNDHTILGTIKERTMHGDVAVTPAAAPVQNALKCHA